MSSKRKEGVSAPEKTKRAASASPKSTKTKGKKSLADKRQAKAGAKGTVTRPRRSSGSENETTAANETTAEKTSVVAAKDDGLIRHKKPTREERAEATSRERAEKAQVRKGLEERYDVNLKDSDDSSDEEVLLRTGDVPEHWYDLYEHRGYSVKGEAVGKLPEQDELEKFLERQNDKMWWTKILDKLNNKHVRLSKADIGMIQRIRQGTWADASIDPYAENLQVDLGNTNWIHPFNNAHTPKRGFIMSKWERLKIAKYAQALKKGWMKTLAEKKAEEEELEKEAEKVWDIWEDDSIVTWRPRKMPKAITAPKRDLPQHAESFNPPEEYLFDDQEKEQWEKDDEDDRQLNYIPQKFEALRKVPGYAELIREHFERCLDLYLCPRLLRKKVNLADASKLIPELPSPNDLKPFPVQVSIEFNFHTTTVRSIAVSPNGMYLASADEDHNLVIWNCRSGKIARQYRLPNRIVDNVEWCPDMDRCLLAVANEDKVHLIAPELYRRDITRHTKEMLMDASKTYAIDAAASDKKEQLSKWVFHHQNKRNRNKVEAEAAAPVEPEEKVHEHILCTIEFKNVISRLSWHTKGDFLSTMAHNIQSTSQVLIHSIGQAVTQKPFSTTNGIIQCVSFHPTKPHFFACTQTTVFQYNLQKQSIVSKYRSGAKWISSISIHPKGDNFILGTYDKKVLWFDMDMSGEVPYKSLKYHEKAIRKVSYHSNAKYPLFASASDDGAINIFYGMVYNDLLQNALVVPVKVLKGAHSKARINAKTQKKIHQLGTMACVWHPQQPWLFSAGADGTIKLWV